MPGILRSGKMWSPATYFSLMAQPIVNNSAPFANVCRAAFSSSAGGSSLYGMLASTCLTSRLARTCARSECNAAVSRRSLLTVAKASVGLCAFPGFAATLGSLPKANRLPIAAAVPSLRRKARRLVVAGMLTSSNNRIAWKARRGPSTRTSSRAMPRPVHARTLSPSTRNKVGVQGASGPSARSRHPCTSGSRRLRAVSRPAERASRSWAIFVQVAQSPSKPRQ
ncbi:hypothetical protein Sthe_2478 [Sphaerobacter thermophilus DSM 20745]|uniref:Uncharacterized protein n=1 Tax=Sphaerobacter thermophilus (strain ATCC 49802 / DSM 20745 / KCCM 41009 / NCIMB 13125 / S 6022) TaxID=479434 RepID=D1CAU6_SPHTD|nr:hypothetical protein Sthe_2478 [Sphaerobacter thermophilus DSM 20745]